METANTIERLISGGESKRMEFKTSRIDVESLAAVICAFLNSGGGQILIGVNDEGKPDGGITAKQVEEKLHPLSGGDEGEAQITPNAVWDLTEEHAGDAVVVLVDVPAGADLPYIFKDKIFVRVGCQTREATGTQIRDLIQKRYLQGARRERQPVLEVTLADLDEEEIQKTVQVAVNRRGWRFRDTGDLTMVLEDLNLIENGRLTHAAVVLFANEAGHILSQTQVRLTAYSSDKAASEYAEDKLARGHLFSHLNTYDAFIDRRVAVISDFSQTKQYREDRPQYPYWPLREGFRNALIHRSYESVQGRVMVSAYPTRFEIWNDGDLPQGLTLTSLKKGDRSIPVNPDIAQVVFLRGLVELLGRGTRKMVEEFRSLGMPDPMWKRASGGIALQLRSRAEASEIPKELNARQLDLLSKCRPGAQTDLQDYMGMHPSMSERALRDDLSKLSRLGYLTRQGKGKSTFYVRTEKPLQNLPDSAEKESTNPNI